MVRISRVFPFSKYEDTSKLLLVQTLSHEPFKGDSFIDLCFFENWPHSYADFSISLHFSTIVAKVDCDIPKLLSKNVFDPEVVFMNDNISNFSLRENHFHFYCIKP